jgi:hypothetical protein
MLAHAIDDAGAEAAFVDEDRLGLVLVRERARRGPQTSIVSRPCSRRSPKETGP